MLILIHAPIDSAEAHQSEAAITVERLTLAKRLWRGTAEDGQEFGFELSAPLKHGDTVWVTDVKKYVVRQRAEAVLEISLDVTPSAAAGIGWAVGNLHLELSAEPQRLLAADEPATRALLGRLTVPYTSTIAIFRPGRFARGGSVSSPHELGPSHQH